MTRKFSQGLLIFTAFIALGWLFGAPATAGFARGPGIDFFLEIPMGSHGGISSEDKFGKSTNVDNGVVTDIWDRANTVDDDDIWTAPTQARTHQIKSSSSSDDGDPVGVGARTIKIFGLVDWDTAEVNETITLNGTGNVPTINQYVIIHRLQVLTKGATSINVGIITATADTDTTVTAQINVGEGQTQMAVYGIPSVRDAYLLDYYASFDKSGGATGAADISLLVNPTPNDELLNFVTKHVQSIFSAGDSHIDHAFLPYFKVPGPAIIKMEAVGSVDNLTVSAGFSLILIDNTL